VCNTVLKIAYSSQRSTLEVSKLDEAKIFWRLPTTKASCYVFAKSPCHFTKNVNVQKQFLTNA
jgi:hypothetical protein